MTLEQFITDTLSVTDYLRNRFGTEKIYLMAHKARKIMRENVLAGTNDLADGEPGR